MMFFKEWKEAHTAACKLANELGREVGISKAKEYDKDGFKVHSLPKPENRQGYELRAEVVTPGTPI